MKEYTRGDVTTNSVEGFFGVFKRGLVGVHQHCGEQHLQRYLEEFTFRYSCRSIGDAAHSKAVLYGTVGKKLTYRRLGGA